MYSVAIQAKLVLNIYPQKGPFYQIQSHIYTLLFVENHPVRRQSLSRSTVCQSFSQSAASFHHHYVIVTMVLKFNVEGKMVPRGESTSFDHHCPPLVNELGWSSKGTKYWGLM